MKEKTSRNICLVAAIIAVFLTLLLHISGWRETRPGYVIAGVYLFALVATLFNQQKFQKGILRVALVIFALLLGFESLGAFLSALFPHFVR